MLNSIMPSILAILGERYLLTQGVRKAGRQIIHKTTIITKGALKESKLIVKGIPISGPTISPVLLVRITLFFSNSSTSGFYTVLNNFFP